MPRVAGESGVVECLADSARLAALSLSQWDRLLRLARASNLMGRLLQVIDAAGPALRLPPEVEPHLQAVRVLTSHQREAVVWECNRIAQAISGLGTPLLLLKGAAYVMADLPAAHGRLFGDIDLLVQRTQIDEVERVLRLHGWFMGQVSAYDEDYYRRWMHELPPMTHALRHTSIDVHHNILPPSSGHAPDPSVLLALSVPIPGTVFRRLCDEDMVIHSASHLFHEGEVRHALRDLYDLDALLRGFSLREGFWDRLLARARQLRLEWCCHLALRYSRAILGTPVPDAVCAAAARQSGVGSLRQMLLDAVYRRAFRAQHPEFAGPSDRAAARYLYVRSHALRMPPHLLLAHLTRKAWTRAFTTTSVRIGAG
ncbi:MAG: nucleotidyltransferase family protein [Betaproteobacteria bacterium]|nr:nucleotidyltransferase family protein [Betaproteobacteria bacterium]